MFLLVYFRKLSDFARNSRIDISWYVALWLPSSSSGLRYSPAVNFSCVSSSSCYVEKSCSLMPVLPQWLPSCGHTMRSLFVLRPLQWKWYLSFPGLKNYWMFNQPFIFTSFHWLEVVLWSHVLKMAEWQAEWTWVDCCREMRVNYQQRRFTLDLRWARHELPS